MPHPTSALTTLRPDLGGSLEEIDLAMDRLGFIGPELLTPIDVAKQSGTFGLVTRETLLNPVKTQRAPGTPYPRGGFNFGEGSFATEEYGFEALVDHREAAIYSEFFDAELIAAGMARDVVLRDFEDRCATMMQNTSTFTNAARTDSFDTAASATPIADVLTRKLHIHDATGMWPNCVVITRKMAEYIILTDEFIGKSQYVANMQRGKVSYEDIRTALDVEYLLVANSIKNSANEGQTASLESLWDDDIMGVGVKPTTTNIKEPCAGRIIHWGGDGSDIGAAMESYEETRTRSTVIRARIDTDEITIVPELWELVTGCCT